MIWWRIRSMIRNIWNRVLPPKISGHLTGSSTQYFASWIATSATSLCPSFVSETPRSVPLTLKKKFKRKTKISIVIKIIIVGWLMWDDKSVTRRRWCTLERMEATRSSGALRAGSMREDRTVEMLRRWDRRETDGGCGGLGRDVRVWGWSNLLGVKREREEEEEDIF